MNREPRLRSIYLRDFKSVRDQTVSLGPLTAVVGANSAGKSTLLQAILTLAQAVQSKANTPDFPLNGPLIRLGTFEETLNYLAPENVGTFELRFEVLDSSPLAMQLSLPFDDDLDLAIDDTDESLRERIVSWHAVVEPVVGDSRSGGRGFAQIERLRLAVSPLLADGDVGQPAYVCDIVPKDDLAEAGELASARPAWRGLSPGGRPRPLPVEGRVRDHVSGTAPPLDAVALSGGVPHWFFERTTRLNHLSDLWWATVHSVLEEAEGNGEQLEGLITDDEARDEASGVADLAREYASDHIRELVEGDLGKGARPLSRGRRLVKSEYHFFFSKLTKLVNQLEPDEQLELRQSCRIQGEVSFREALRDRLGDLAELHEPVLFEHSGAAVEYLAQSGRTAQRFFSSGIRYLGPLREAPNVLYDPGPGQIDIGSKGEYAAAVLHAQADSPVHMPPIPGELPSRHAVTLNEALNAWLSWFGLADGANAQDRGRLGIGLSVTPHALGRPVDLTSVGVGVSQVLPVILVCLLARPGTLVILEQPELHLHPKLQQDLADFFLACVESGRQIVLETHSEHLVNRLRRRVAGDESDATRELVKLIFAENTDGITTYRESQVNPYGGLDDDWPDGFLDVGARESRALVKESAAKRRREIAEDTD